MGLLAGLLAAAALQAASVPASFERDLLPVLSQSCQVCHNDKLTSGGLNLTPFLQASSITSNREGWEIILPKGIPKPPPAQMDALLKYVQANSTAPTARLNRTAYRLNRNEYASTVRDLLGVESRAQEEFPADDSGYGFDNIGDVLTVSPALMQKYLSVAEKIAAHAVGGDPFPKLGIFSRKDRVRRMDTGTTQLEDLIVHDADYVVRTNLVGHRGPQDKPLTLVLSVDGKPVKTATVAVQISASTCRAAPRSGE